MAEIKEGGGNGSSDPHSQFYLFITNMCVYLFI